MHASSSVYLIVLALLIALVTEITLATGASTFPILFVLPILLAGLRLSTRSVLVVALLSLTSYLGASLIGTSPSLRVITVSGVGLVAIAAFAVQSSQRQLRASTVQQELSLRERELEQQLFTLTDHDIQVQAALAQTPVSAFAQDEHLRYKWAINLPPPKDEHTVVGSTDEDIFDEHQAERLSDTKRKVLQTGVRAQQELVLTANGQSRTYDLYVQPLRATDHTIIGVTGTAVDVSQWAEARKHLRALVDREVAARFEAGAEQRRLRRMYQQVHRFVASVAHELSQPLTVISGFAQRLEHRARARLDESEHRMIRMILDAGQRAQRMVRDLRTTSTVATGNFDIQPFQMDLTDAVQQIINELPDTERARVVFTAPDRVNGIWDRDRIMQVAANLLSNALKYSGSESEVEVDVSQQDHYARLSVRDHGPGISPEDQDKLFEAYTRLDGTAKVEGSGLGLYVARCVVEAHNGWIWVDSEPGRGSAFHVTLPVGDVSA